MKKRFAKTTKATKIMMASLVGILTIGTMAQAAVTQYENDTLFTNELIPGYELGFRNFVSGNMVNAGSSISVKVNRMVDEDGNDKPNWKKTRWRVWKIVDKKEVMCSDVTIVNKSINYTKIALYSKEKTTTGLHIEAAGNLGYTSCKVTGAVQDFKS